MSMAVAATHVMTSSPSNLEPCVICWAPRVLSAAPQHAFGTCAFDHMCHQTCLVQWHESQRGPLSRMLLANPHHANAAGAAIVAADDAMACVVCHQTWIPYVPLALEPLLQRQLHGAMPRTCMSRTHRQTLRRKRAHWTRRFLDTVQRQQQQQKPPPPHPLTSPLTYVARVADSIWRLTQHDVNRWVWPLFQVWLFVLFTLGAMVAWRGNDLVRTACLLARLVCVAAMSWHRGLIWMFAMVTYVFISLWDGR